MYPPRVVMSLKPREEMVRFEGQLLLQELSTLVMMEVYLFKIIKGI